MVRLSLIEVLTNRLRYRIISCETVKYISNDISNGDRWKGMIVEGRWMEMIVKSFSVKSSMLV